MRFSFDPIENRTLIGPTPFEIQMKTPPLGIAAAAC
jgi:hypothetical protein